MSNSAEVEKILNKMGVPMSTPVHEAGELPERCDKLIISIFKAATACRSSAFAYAEDQNVSNYAHLKRTHRKLGREIAKIPAPNWVDMPDGGKHLANPEDSVVRAFVGSRCFTAYENLTEILNELDNGRRVTLTSEQLWPTEVEQ